jgi:hypothetical protein
VNGTLKLSIYLDLGQIKKKPLPKKESGFDVELGIPCEIGG